MKIGLGTKVLQLKLTTYSTNRGKDIKIQNIYQRNLDSLKTYSWKLPLKKSKTKNIKDQSQVSHTHFTCHSKCSKPIILMMKSWKVQVPLFELAVKQWLIMPK